MRLVYERDEQGFLRENLDPKVIEDGGPMDAEACLRVLRRNRVGRLGFVRFDVPVLLPVNYGVDAEGRIAFRTARGSKLWVAENEVLSAAFEVDEHDVDADSGVAVVVSGPMTAVTDLVEIAALETLGVTPFATAIERPTWVRITPRDIEGWTFGGGAGA